MKPLLSGVDLKDRTVRDYKRMAERAGLSIDMAAIERLAAADCELGENVERAAQPAVAAKADPEKEQAKAGELDRQVAEAGGSIVRDPRKMARKRLAALHAVPKPGSRWSNALARIGRIVNGATPSTDRKVMVATCEMPKLAWEVLRIQAYVVTRHVPPRFGDEPNPFYGLSTADFVAKFKRMIEDVCDKSTGKLGSWRTPR